MAKNINHIQHVKSNVVLEGKPKLPESGVLVEGELAVNYSDGYETISLENTNNEIVTFSSDEYYTKQKLGSGFTGVNSGNTVTQVIEDNELVWTNAYVTLSGAVSSHTSNNDIHLTQTEKTNIDSLATNIAAISGVSSTKVSNWDSAATNSHTHSNKTYLDGITGTVGTMAYEDKTSYSSATEVNTALGNKANTSDLNNFFDDAKYEDSGTTKVINFYHGNTIKATIDASDFIVDGMVDDVRIENGNLVIDFNTASGKQDISIPLTDIFDPSNYYNKTAIDSLVGSGFTSSSITDVIIENEEIVSAALTDLDERKLDASAYTPTDLSNYYTKSETSGATELATAFNAKVNTADIVTAITTANSASTNAVSVGAVVEAINDTEEVITSAIYDINYTLSGHTANTSVHLTSTEKTNLDSLATNIGTISGITSANVNNWNGKADNSTFTAHTASTVHMSTTEKTNLDSLATNIAAISGISYTKVSNWDTAYTNNHTHSNKAKLDAITGDVGTMAYQNTSSYSSATEVNTALGNKVNTADVVSAITSANSASTNPVSVKVVAENELVVSTALNDLNGAISGINDTISAHTANTNIHLTSTEKTNLDSLATNIAAISGITSANVTSWDNAVSDITDLSGQSETVAAALNELNTNKLDVSALTEVNSAISDLEDIVGSGYANTTITAVIENMDEAVAAAITDLYDSFGKLEEQNDEIVDFIEEKELAISASLTDLNDKIGDIESILATI